MQGGPSPRRISNRVFNDVGQNLFSENDISQWGWAWGQFIDHDIGLRDETPGEDAPIPFDANDPLEAFTNDPGQMAFSRTPAAPGTGDQRSTRASRSTRSAASSTPPRSTAPQPRRDWPGSGRRTGTTCSSPAATCRSSPATRAAPRRRWT